MNATSFSINTVGIDDALFCTVQNLKALRFYKYYPEKGNTKNYIICLPIGLYKNSLMLIDTTNNVFSPDVKLISTNSLCFEYIANSNVNISLFLDKDSTTKTIKDVPSMGCFIYGGEIFMAAYSKDLNSLLYVQLSGKDVMICDYSYFKNPLDAVLNGTIEITTKSNLSGVTFNVNIYQTNVIVSTTTKDGFIFPTL